MKDVRNIFLRNLGDLYPKNPEIDVRTDGYNKRYKVYYFIYNSNYTIEIEKNKELKDVLFRLGELNGLKKFETSIPNLDFHPNIQKYINSKLLDSLISGNITDLFNSNILCTIDTGKIENGFSNSLAIQTNLLPLFETVEFGVNKVKLRYKII